jgi:hypothetical protein
MFFVTAARKECANVFSNVIDRIGHVNWSGMLVADAAPVGDAIPSQECEVPLHAGGYGPAGKIAKRLAVLLTIALGMAAE